MQKNLKLKQLKKFKVEDKVRISKYKSVFDRGYSTNWTTELFIVLKVLNTNQLHKIINQNEEEIEGIFL